MEKTLEELELALKIDPENYWAVLGTGNHYLYELNDLAQAYIYLQRAIQLNPKQWFAHWSMGDLYERRGDHAAAKSSRQRARTLKQRNHPCRNTKEFFVP